ncbi:transporter substrate-binding domain-containing protein [Mesorhizobium sp. M0622]|uniref:transporter substrate-binding domain-containing protein n=2 Tax=Mesorhizobium TaxID=68287 RepID=UPI003334F3EE
MSSSRSRTAGRQRKTRRTGSATAATASSNAFTSSASGSKDQMVQFDDLSKCLDAVRTGQVEAMAADNATLMGFMSQDIGAYKMVGEAFANQPFGVGIKHGDKAFCHFISDTLKEAEADGRMAEAWKKTAGQAEPTVPKLPELEDCDAL